MESDMYYRNPDYFEVLGQKRSSANVRFAPIADILTSPDFRRRRASTLLAQERPPVADSQTSQLENDERPDATRAIEP
jgi:hypothetical protein